MRHIFVEYVTLVEHGTYLWNMRQILVEDTTDICGTCDRY